MSLLDKWLSKKGIKSIEELEPEERAIYDSYKITLTGRTLSVKDIEEFCLNQVKLIEGKFGTFQESSKYDQYLKACAHIYLTILKMIEAPKVEREKLERYLISIINEQ